MIFCGDLVFPGAFSDQQLICDDSRFWRDSKFINLESSIRTSPTQKITRGVALQSSPCVADFLCSISASAVSFANNHFFDYQINCVEQKEFLSGRGISSIGAGENLKQASQPYFNKEENTVVLAFGWHVIGCPPANESSAGVNPHNYEWVLACVSDARKKYPNALLVVVFHWNYEFEQYPQPADRAFAFHLIDSGADAIVGHHAHIIQGFEYYQGKPIFYGLGNLYFPNGEYDGLNVAFPETVNFGLSVGISTDGIQAYITEFTENSRLRVVEQGPPESLERLTRLSNFSGMSHQEYIDFFKVHRKKNKLLPIYRDFQAKSRNRMRDRLVKTRQVPIDLLCRLRGAR